MLDGFKQFVLRGNVVDMAVGVVVGGAFTTVVLALTKDLLTPLIAAFFDKPDFSAIRFTVNGSVFAIGDFINALVSFLLIAAAVYFFVIVPINAMTKKGSKLISKVILHDARDLENALCSLEHSEKETLANLLHKLGYGANARSADNGSNVQKEQTNEKTGYGDSRS
jgi:large conductance mechanosensitive channel